MNTGKHIQVNQQQEKKREENNMFE